MTDADADPKAHPLCLDQYLKLNAIAGTGGQAKHAAQIGIRCARRRYLRSLISRWVLVVLAFFQLLQVPECEPAHNRAHQWQPNAAGPHGDPDRSR